MHIRDEGRSDEGRSNAAHWHTLAAERQLEIDRLRNRVADLENYEAMVMERCGELESFSEYRKALGMPTFLTIGDLAALSKWAKEALGDIDQLRTEASLYHAVMQCLRSMELPHGTCQPRERMACTHCNEKERLAALVGAYTGPRLVRCDA